MFFRVYLQGEEEVDELIYSQDSSIVGVSDIGDNIVDVSSGSEHPTSPIVIDDSSDEIIPPTAAVELEQTINTARPYRCGKCGQIKKGHSCPVVDGLTPLRPEQRRAPRQASKPGNLTRLAQRVEGDNLADPDFVPVLRQSPRLIAEKRTRRLTSLAVEETENEPSNKRRKVYECQRCKVPKKGHKCPTTSFNDVTVRQLCETPLIILNRVEN